MNRPMTDPGSHEAVRERISDRPDRICDPRATLPGTGERVPRGYSSVGNPTAATEATAAHRELSPDAPQGEAQRRPERTPAAASAVEELRGAIEILGGSEIENPMYGAHLVLALTALARRLDHVY